LSSFPRIWRVFLLFITSRLPELEYLLVPKVLNVAEAAVPCDSLNLYLLKYVLAAAALPVQDPYNLYLFMDSLLLRQSYINKTFT